LRDDAHRAEANAPNTDIPRRVELLLHLSGAAPDGMPLRELVDTGGRSDRNAQAATMNMLRRLRERHLVEFAPRASQEAGRGRLYRITRAGIEWLQQGRQPLPGKQPPTEAPVVETGAMRGERPTVVIRDAQLARSSRPVQPCWVFGLGHQARGLNAG